jgi:hypothetical protein
LALTLPLLLSHYRVADGGWYTNIEFLHYSVPMFFITLFFVARRIKDNSELQARNILLDAAVLFLVASRMLTDIVPFSGHMLFLSYSFLTQKCRFYKILCLLYLLHATYVKLFLWGDPMTWAIGGLAGYVAARLHRD